MPGEPDLLWLVGLVFALMAAYLAGFALYDKIKKRMRRHRR